MRAPSSSSSRNGSIFSQGDEFKASICLKFVPIHSFFSSFGEPLAHIVSEPVRTFYVAFGMQKDSPFTAKFSATFTRLIEAGLLLKWTADEMDKVARVAEGDSSSAEPKPFVLAQIQGTLYIALLGLGLSFLAFLLEVTCGQNRDRRHEMPEKDFLDRSVRRMSNVLFD